jgi:anthranilate synthase component 2
MPELIRKYAPHKDILGICLGNQAIGEAFGGGLINLTEVVHGVASKIKIRPDALFEGLPEYFTVGRYHSWVIDATRVPEDLEVISNTPDGQIMAIRHKKFNVKGLQFHPESILTEHGVQIMKNWLEGAKITNR